VDVLDSCNLSIDNVFFSQLGGFGRDFPGASLLEDCVFGWRAQRKGFRLIKDTDLRVESHEETISLRRVGERELRLAEAYVTLAKVFPDEFDSIQYLSDNGPVRATDPAATKVKKVLRNLLSRGFALEVAQVAGEVGDRMRLPDRVLHPYFDRVIGLHTVRGLRIARSLPSSVTQNREVTPIR
jgi:hypothetical protein